MVARVKAMRWLSLMEIMAWRRAPKSRQGGAENCVSPRYRGCRASRTSTGRSQDLVPFAWN